jgi:ADP-heptose:LPS heptosyltransferase
MTVELMRKVDRYIGISLCLVLSVFDRILKFLPRKKSTTPNKILILQLSEMGATVLVRPSIEYTKERYPDADIFYLIFEEIKESLFPLGMIPKENVLTITSSSMTGLTKDTIKVLYRLRKEKLDVAVDLELFSRYSNLLSYLSGAKNRIGFDNFYAEGLYRGNLLTHRVHYNYYNHISLNFLALFKAIPANEKDIPLVKEEITRQEIDYFYIESTKEAKRLTWEKLREENPDISTLNKLIVLNPNASERLPLRRWPVENYIKLTEMLLENPDYYVILTGAGPDMPDVLKICNAVRNDRCINLATKTTIRELIDLYNVADILVSNDSGPPHFASLTKIRIIVLFGPETPAMYAPLSSNLEVVYRNLACSPCVSAFSHRKSICKNNLCLKLITVDDIFRRVNAYLTQNLQ